MDIDLFVRSENCYSDLKSTNIDYRELLCNKITTTEEILEKYGQMYYLVYPYTCEMDIEHNKVVAKYAAEMMDKPTDEEYVSYEKKMKYSVTYKGMFILKVDKSNKDYLLKKGEVSGGRVKYKISAKNLDNFILYREGKISKKELIDTRIDVEE